MLLLLPQLPPLQFVALFSVACIWLWGLGIYAGLVHELFTLRGREGV